MNLKEKNPNSSFPFTFTSTFSSAQWPSYLIQILNTGIMGTPATPAAPPVIQLWISATLLLAHLALSIKW